MELTFLTEAQKNCLVEVPNEYSESDLAELACLARSLEVLVDIMLEYHRDTDEDGREPWDGKDYSIYGIIKLILEPIATFLFEGAPMAEEPKEEEPGEASISLLPRAGNEEKK
jgi:hypothetical protein